MEGQVARYKTAAENAERVEDELKAEKRKLQREVTKCKLSQASHQPAPHGGRPVCLVHFGGGTIFLGRAKNKRLLFLLL